MDDKKQRFLHLFNIDGDVGKSLLYKKREYHSEKIENWTISEVYYKDIEKKIDFYNKKVKNLKDDRSLVIVGALIIEHALDEFLSNWIKKYKIIRDNSYLTFSLKIQLGLSLNIIPAIILNSIEPIRQIRNYFAHHLEIADFDDLEDYISESNNKRKKNGLKKMDYMYDVLYNKLENFFAKDFLDDKEDDIKIMFRYLVLSILVSFVYYGKQLKVIDYYIRDEENLDRILYNF